MRVWMRADVCLIAAVLAGALPAAAASLIDPALGLETVSPGLDRPTGIRFLGPGDTFVIEKNTGKVKRVQGTTVSEVLDLDVRANSERGLIGIELHPDFDPDDADPNDFVYLYYSVPMPGSPGNWAENRLSRFTWNGANLVNETELFSIDFDATPGIRNGPNHDGGPLRFGPDGKLYLATGDLNRNRAEQNNAAQATTSALTGGLYRFNDDGTIPSDNPFSGNPNGNFRGLYAYGVRNSFGMAFDPLTGDLWDTENGPDRMDEINRVEAGFNSGWRLIMGPESRDANTPDDLVDLIVGTSTYSDPEFSFADTIGVTSIQFLAGSALGPAYDDAVLVGDSFGRSGPPGPGALYLFRLNEARDGFVLSGDMADLVEDPGDDLGQILFGTDFGTITDIEIGPDGFVHVLSMNGDIHRIVPEPGTAGTLGLGLAVLAALGRRLGGSRRRNGRRHPHSARLRLAARALRALAGRRLGSLS